MIKLIKDKREELAGLCRKYHIKRLELFGSAAMGKEFDPGSSDLDFLVEFMPVEDRNFLRDYIGLLEDLEKLFNLKVDLIEDQEFRNPYFREAVNETRTLVYES